jgi:WD40 repeat protein
MQSGHVLHKLSWPGSEDKTNILRSIEKIVFLPKRLSTAAAATLISTGADGVIRWWRFETGELLWEMEGTQGQGEGIYAMCIDELNTILVTGDSRGWVTIYDISRTCYEESDYINPPTVLAVFRSHVKSIVSIELFESNFIVTASGDGTSRIFTVDPISVLQSSY